MKTRKSAIALTMLIALCNLSQMSCLSSNALALTLQSTPDPAAVTPITITLNVGKDNLFVPSDGNQSYGGLDFQLVGGSTPALNASALNFAPISGMLLLSISFTTPLFDTVPVGLSVTLPFGHYANWTEASTNNSVTTGQTFVTDGNFTGVTSLLPNGKYGITYSSQDFTDSMSLQLLTGATYGFFWQATALAAIEPFGGFSYTKDSPVQSFRPYATAVVLPVPEPSTWAVLGLSLAALALIQLRSRRAGLFSDVTLNS